MIVTGEATGTLSANYRIPPRSLFFFFLLGLSEVAIQCFTAQLAGPSLGSSGTQSDCARSGSLQRVGETRDKLNATGRMSPRPTI